MNDEFDASEFPDFDIDKIAMEVAAKPLAVLYKAFIKEGISPREAAVIVAAMAAQKYDQPPQNPEGDNDGQD